MANPPITIGPFTNVPAPGSPIRSDWPQQITTYVVNRTSYSVARIVFNGTVTTNASADFAVPTGFAPSAAICQGFDPAYPTTYIVRDLNSTQVVWRAFESFGGGGRISTTLPVTYVIYGPAA